LRSIAARACALVVARRAAGEFEGDGRALDEAAVRAGDFGSNVRLVRAGGEPVVTGIFLILLEGAAEGPDPEDSGLSPGFVREWVAPRLLVEHAVLALGPAEGPAIDD